MAAQFRQDRLDIRDTAEFARVNSFYQDWHSPGFGTVSSANSPSAAPDGSSIAFAGEVRRDLHSLPTFRLGLTTDTGFRTLTEPADGVSELNPAFSPDGASIAFTSDADTPGVQQISLLSLATEEVTRAPQVEGTIEYLQWSPDGTRILVGVAGLGAALSGGQGSGSTSLGNTGDELPAWTPQIESGISPNSWRSVWIFDVTAGSVRKLKLGLNSWEAAWNGPESIIVVASDSPDEGAWYTARLHTVDLATESIRTIFTPETQIGWPAASPSGARQAVVEAICSDRWLVAGEVHVFDSSGATTIHPLDTDITHLQWLDDDRLAFMGMRGLDTVAGVYDVSTGASRELWSSDTTCGDRYPVGSFLSDESAAIVHSSYTDHPAVAWLKNCTVTPVATFRHSGIDEVASRSGSVEAVSWNPPDGTEIQGLLVTPDGKGPFPLVLNVHGGPVWGWRNHWNLGIVYPRLLADRGYAVLHPNPRGSSGRGQDFARAVFGDPGGADTDDYLSGIDALVERGIADPDRIGVTGASYGGFMSAWLITQDQRFAAAVPMAPVTDWYSQHYTSNIPYFDELILKGEPEHPTSLTFERSPVWFANRVITPTLQTAGSVDVCTPPGQATEFHNALLAAGVNSYCLVYPGEGHGIRKLPALIDQTTRTLEWFDSHMGPGATAAPVAATAVSGKVAP